MERFRLEVGHNDSVKPGNIVGAIANEAGIDSKFIGRITIYDEFSVIDLPEGMPPQVFKHLEKVWVANKQLGISRIETGGARAPAFRKTIKREGKPPRKKDF
jgi:ATP-dependent RNA helicase DeaD